MFCSEVAIYFSHLKFDNLLFLSFSNPINFTSGSNLYGMQNKFYETIVNPKKKMNFFMLQR